MTENKAFTALMRDDMTRVSNPQKTVQLTLRLPAWQVDALLDDASKEGIRHASMQDVMSRVVNLHLDAAGYEEPAQQADLESLQAGIKNLVENDQRLGIKLMQLISSAMAAKQNALILLVA